MSFLAKFGSIALKVVGIASGLLPLVSSALPGKSGAVVAAIDDKLSKALSVVITAEQMFSAAGVQKAGSQKLAASVPFVSQLILNTDLLVGKHPKDEAKFTDAVTRLTAALADVLNSFE